MSYRFLSTILGIDANFTGKLGVGTTTPTRIIQLTEAEPAIRFNPTSVAGNYLLMAADGKFYFTPESTFVSTMTLSSGNVGIGTTSPVTKVDINYADNTYSAGLTITNTTNASQSQSKINIVNSAGTVLALMSQSPSVNSGVSFITTSNTTPLVFGTGYLEKMRIDSAGNVGIGTTSPSYKLDVNGAVRIQGNTGIYFDTTGGTANNYVGITNDYWTTLTCGRGYTSAIDLTNGNGVILRTNGSERMRVEVSGNVLIGTTTDAGYKLDVNGDIRLNKASSSPILLVQGGGDASGGGKGNIRSGDQGGTNYWDLGRDNLYTGDFVISNTSSTVFRINISGAATFSSSVTATDFIQLNAVSGYASKLIFYRAGYNYWNVGTPSNSTAFAISESSDLSSPALFLKTGGNVGIGTTSPSYKLDVNGSIYWGNPSGEYMYAGGGGHKFAYSNTNSNYLYSGGSAGLLINNQADNTTLVRITDTGNVLIGNTTDAGYKLDVNGTGRFLNSITTFAGSSTYYGKMSTEYNYPYIQTYIDSFASTSWDSTLSFRTNSNNGTLNTQMFINPFGNVGIGETNPQAKLHIASNSLGFTQYDYSPAQNIFTYTGNSEVLEFGALRTANGSDWTSDGFRIQEKVDSTWMGYIQFNGDGNNAGISFGTGASSASRHSISERMRITANGNVLIGTTTDAGYKLDVNGTGRFSGAVITTSAVTTNQTGGQFAYQGSSVTLLGAWGANSSTRGILSFYLTDSNGTIGNEYARLTDSSYYVVPTTTLNSLSGSGTRMVVADASGTLSTQSIPTGTVTGSGTTNYVSKWSSSSSLSNSVMYDDGTNVGIGTTTPYTILELKSTDPVQRFSVTGGVANNKTYEVRAIGASGYEGLQFRAVNDANTVYDSLMFLSRNGNVGIGTTSPQALLTVGYQNTSSELLRFGVNYNVSNAQRGAITWHDGSGITGKIWTSYDGSSTTSMFFGGLYNSAYDQAAYLTIRGNGNVGIGTSSPNTKLDVNGGLKYNFGVATSPLAAFTSTTGGLYTYYSSPVAIIAAVSDDLGTGTYLDLYSGSNRAIRITPSTNVLIGTTTDNGSKLQINGESWTNGAAKITYTNPLLFESYGGGWFMQDTTYIRTYNDKSVWTGGGYLASQGGLSVGYGGANPGSQNAIIAGNVGIGTTSPTEKLDIVGIIASSRGVYGNPSSSDGYRLKIQDYGGVHNDAGIGVESYLGAMWFNNVANGGFYWNDGTNGEKMRLSASGNLLIGTTTDAGYKLDVNGSSRIKGSGSTSGTTTFRVENSSGGSPFTILGDGTVNMSFNANLTYNLSARAYTSNGGYGAVGVYLFSQNYGNSAGTAATIQYTGSPAGVTSNGLVIGGGFALQSATYNALAVNQSYTGLGTNTFVGYLFDPTLDATFPAANIISIKTTKGNALLCTTSGNVGIGTTNPSYKLDVNGTGGFSSYLAILNGSRIYFNNPINTGSGNIYCPGGGSLSLQAYNQEMLALVEGDRVTISTATVERMRITSAGNVLIGTTTDNGGKLQVNGDAYFGTFLNANFRYSFIGSGQYNSYHTYIVNTNSSNGTYGLGVNNYNTSSDGYILGLSSAGIERFYVKNDGNVNASSLAGSGTRMVVANASGTLSTQAIPSPTTKSFGAFQEDTTQTAASNNTGYGVKFTTPDISGHGVDVIGDPFGNRTYILFSNSGFYNIQFSFQFQNTNNQIEDVTVWLRKNGNNPSDDIPATAGFVSVPNSHGGTPGTIIAAWNYFVEAASGDFFQLVWSTSNSTHVTMEYYPAGSPPPSAASAILTVNQVD